MAADRFPEDFPPALVTAVNAYDEARRDRHTSPGAKRREPAMSDANKATIAPLILAAVRAYNAPSGKTGSWRY